VSHFERISIFYRPTDYGIDVVRVLHGARDIARILRRER
jgi:plasmid stabilization system protein ParE